MTQSLGRKIDDDRERSVLLAYQQCIDKSAQRFIIEDVDHPDDLEKALHLLLSDVWPPGTYRIRQIIQSGIHMRFVPFNKPRAQQTVGEWIGNRRHGLVFVDVIHDLRVLGNQGS